MPSKGFKLKRGTPEVGDRVAIHTKNPSDAAYKNGVVVIVEQRPSYEAHNNDDNEDIAVLNTHLVVVFDDDKRKEDSAWFKWHPKLDRLMVPDKSVDVNPQVSHSMGNTISGKRVDDRWITTAHDKKLKTSHNTTIKNEISHVAQSIGVRTDDNEAKAKDEPAGWMNRMVSKASKFFHA